MHKKPPFLGGFKQKSIKKFMTKGGELNMDNIATLKYIELGELLSISLQ